MRQIRTKTDEADKDEGHYLGHRNEKYSSVALREDCCNKGHSDEVRELME
jgi:hypothetical protein